MAQPITGDGSEPHPDSLRRASADANPAGSPLANGRADGAKNSALGEGWKSYVAALANETDDAGITLDDVDSMMRVHRTPLHAAILVGDRRVALDGFKYRSGRLKWRNARRTGDATLAQWIRLRREELVDRLIAAGAKVNQQDLQGVAPLHWAADRGLVDVAERLLAAGADVNLRNWCRQFTPLHRAARNARPEMVRLLLEHGADANAADRDGFTPLHEAAMGNCARSVELLLAHGAAPNAATIKHKRRVAGERPLHFAARGDARIVELLLKAGADANAVNEYGTTALHHASTAEAVHLLIAHGASVDGGFPQSWTPLMSAVRNCHQSSHLPAAQALLAHGADPNAESQQGDTPLILAVRDEQMTALLLAHGARPEPNRREGKSALHQAISYECTPRLAEMLIAAGADVNARMYCGTTPLIMTAHARDQANAQLLAMVLLKHGADPAVKNSAGESALDKALQWKNYQLAEYLRTAIIRHGAFH